MLIGFNSCLKQSTKQTLTPELRQLRITAALNTSNPNRLLKAEKILLANSIYAGYYLQEVIATNQKTGLKSFGYIMLKKESSNSQFRVESEVAPGWGTFTGFLLYNDGCFYHGTFYWSGDESNHIFIPDNNPYGDNYVGNEPICMSDDEFESFC